MALWQLYACGGGGGGGVIAGGGLGGRVLTHAGEKMPIGFIRVIVSISLQRCGGALDVAL